MCHKCSSTLPDVVMVHKLNLELSNPNFLNWDVCTIYLLELAIKGANGDVAHMMALDLMEKYYDWKIKDEEAEQLIFEDAPNLLDRYNQILNSDASIEKESIIKTYIELYDFMQKRKSMMLIGSYIESGYIRNLIDNAKSHYNNAQTIVELDYII